MRSFFWPLVICIVPAVLALTVDGMATQRYLAGEGGFRIGVDLGGGTTLIYEVDLNRFNPPGELPDRWVLTAAGRPSQEAYRPGRRVQHYHPGSE